MTTTASAITPPAATLDAQQTFRVLLNAMARPGTVHTLPVRAGTSPERAVCFALLDFEVSYAIANSGDGNDTDALEQWIALHTGCRRAEVADATFVLAYGPLPDAAWAAIRRGTLAFPDTGATIIHVLPAVGEASPDSDGTRLTLRGPGIEDVQELIVAGLAPSAFASLAHANREYPLGVDVILLDRMGRVACLPRSTHVHAIAITHTEG